MRKGPGRVSITTGCVASIFIMPLFFCVTSIWIYPLTMSYYYREDIAEIERRYLEFDKLLRRGKYKEAYEYMSPSYRRINSYEDFVKGKGFFVAGGWEIMHPNRAIWVRGNRGTIFPGNGSEFLATGPEYELVQENGVWYFTGDSVWYID